MSPTKFKCGQGTKDYEMDRYMLLKLLGRAQVVTSLTTFFNQETSQRTKENNSQS